MNELTHSVEDAARLMGCTPRWLADQLRAGRFAARKINRKWRMTDADIAAAIESCRVAPRTELALVGMTATSRRRIAS